MAGLLFVDVSAVDILEESKGVTLEGIEEDLQREIRSEAFPYYRDQVKLAAEANQALDRASNGETRQKQQSQKQPDNQAVTRSRSRDSKRLSSRSGERESLNDSATKVILNIGMMDGMVISKSIADGKASVAVSTVGMASFPRRRSRSASNSSQHRRDQILQTEAGKVDSTREEPFTSGLQVSHIEASGSALRTGVQDPNAPGYILIPSGNGSGKAREPFTVRAAAVAEAAANMAMSAAPPRQTFSVQRTYNQVQQRPSQSKPDGMASSVPGGATKNIPPNFFTNNSSLTGPLMTIVSSKASTPREATSSINNIQLQFQETPDPYAARPQTPYGGLMGASISSPRASNAITAQAAGIFISTQQRPAKPPNSPRQILLQRPGSILSSEHQAPISQRKLQQRQQEDGLSLVATSPGSLTMTPTTLAISGRTTTHSNNIEAANGVQRLPSKFDSTSGLSGSTLLSTGALDTAMAPSQPKEDLKALLSPRYIVANPVVPSHPAHFSSNLKQSSVRPQGSARGLVGAKSNRRMRQQPSSLATGPASSHLQQQRQPSELQGLSIAPGKLGDQVTKEDVRAAAQCKQQYIAVSDGANCVVADVALVTVPSVPRALWAARAESVQVGGVFLREPGAGVVVPRRTRATGS
ncbi:unnamed protein product [Phytophthora lilii]|uniref:Unnamed protein product n=1 Tax=Phytophthora lilii TaxID=2077276 RepID=A0A9W6TQ96_9STRA|nr:unnamed protein product [Phytophthora lilii]